MGASRGALTRFEAHFDQFIEDEPVFINVSQNVTVADFLQMALDSYAKQRPNKPLLSSNAAAYKLFQWDFDVNYTCSDFIFWHFGLCC